jgi:hypothetical protein
VSEITGLIPERQISDPREARLRSDSFNNPTAYNLTVTGHNRFAFFAAIARAKKFPGSRRVGMTISSLWDGSG